MFKEIRNENKKIMEENIEKVKKEARKLMQLNNEGKVKIDFDELRKNLDFNKKLEIKIKEHEDIDENEY